MSKRLYSLFHTLMLKSSQCWFHIFIKLESSFFQKEILEFNCPHDFPQFFSVYFDASVSTENQDAYEDI